MTETLIVRKPIFSIILILLGVLLFSFIGVLISSPIFDLSSYNTWLVIYIVCISIFTITISFTEFPYDRYNQDLHTIEGSLLLLFLLSCFFSSLTIVVTAENKHYSVIPFYSTLISWSMWSFFRSWENIKLSFLDFILSSSITLGIYISLGLYVFNYAKTPILKLTHGHLLLDIRFLLFYITLFLLLIKAVREASKRPMKVINVFDFEKYDFDATFLELCKPFMVILNFIWRVGYSIFMFLCFTGEELLKKLIDIYERIIQFAINAFIIGLIIIAFYALKFLANVINFYFFASKISDQLLSFLLLIACIIFFLLLTYAISYLNCTTWEYNKLFLSKSKFQHYQKYLLKLAQFILITTWLSSITLFYCTTIQALKINVSFLALFFWTVVISVSFGILLYTLKLTKTYK